MSLAAMIANVFPCSCKESLLCVQILMSVMKALILVRVTKCVLTPKEVLVAPVSLLRYCQREDALLVSFIQMLTHKI